MHKLVSMWIERGYQIINEAKTNNSTIYIMASNGDVVMIQDFGKDGASVYCQHDVSSYCKYVEQIAELQEKLSIEHNRSMALEQTAGQLLKQAADKLESTKAALLVSQKALGEKCKQVSRRNLQIADLKKVIKDLEAHGKFKLV